MSLYEGAVKRPIMTSLVFLAIVILGLFSLSRLPIDLYPDIDTNTIMVMTYYNGASSEDIENNVTRPVENVLNSVEHLKHITSNSKEQIKFASHKYFPVFLSRSKEICFLQNRPSGVFVLLLFHYTKCVTQNV